MNKPEYMDELIAKCLAGEASEAEQDSLNNWMAASDENRKYFSDITLIYEASGKIFSQQKVNTSDAWNSFRRTLPFQEKKSIINSITSSFYAKAAAILLIGGIGYLFYYFSNTAEKQITLAPTLSYTLNDTLPDGTFISLNQKSAITYSSLFNKKNRELKLTGEAYFHVQHNQDLPFIVNAGNVFIKDVGTSFNIKANPADSTILVYVEEGSVDFYSKQEAGITLTKDETGIYNKTAASFRKREDTVSNGKIDNTVPTLKFEGASLRAVIDTLNHAYHVHIVLSCSKLETLKLTAAFSEATVNPIVETIAETLDLSVTKTTGTILLDSESCKN